MNISTSDRPVLSDEFLHSAIYDLLSAIWGLGRGWSLTNKLQTIRGMIAAISPMLVSDVPQQAELAL